MPQKDREYTEYQKQVIRNHYATEGSRAKDNLQKIVTDLYLAETDKKRAQLWKRAEKSLEKLNVKHGLIKHIVSTAKPEVLAAHVERILGKD